MHTCCVNNNVFCSLGFCNLHLFMLELFTEMLLTADVQKESPRSAPVTQRL